MGDLSYFPKTSSELAEWVQAIGTILVLIGAFVIAFLQAWLTLRRDRRAKRERIEGMWTAMRSEVQRCGNIAVSFLEARVAAPSYRFTTVAYDKILPELLIEARLGAQETQDLMGFFTIIDGINAGLDVARDMLNVGNQKRLDEQASLNFHKANDFVRPSSKGYQAAMAVIERHMAGER